MALVFKEAYGLVAMSLHETWGIEGAGFAPPEGDIQYQRHLAEAKVASVSLDFIRSLLCDALALHQETGCPVPGSFFAYRSFFGPEPLGPVRRMRDLSKYAGQPEAELDQLLHRSGELVSDWAFEELWCCSPEAYEFVRSRKKRRMTSKDYAHFIKEIAGSATERRILLSRIASTLETEALVDRTGLLRNQMAYAVWRAITEGRATWEDIPFVQALAKRSVDTIKRHLALGFHGLEEALAAERKGIPPRPM